MPASKPAPGRLAVVADKQRPAAAGGGAIERPDRFIRPAFADAVGSDGAMTNGEHHRGLVGPGLSFSGSAAPAALAAGAFLLFDVLDGFEIVVPDQAGRHAVFAVQQRQRLAVGAGLQLYAGEFLPRRNSGGCRSAHKSLIFAPKLWAEKNGGGAGLNPDLWWRYQGQHRGRYRHG